MSIEIIKDYKDKEYTAIATDNGVVLCEKMSGAFLVLRSSTDLIRLKELLERIECL